METQVCKNCSNTFTESFCNRCGQKEAHRITITHVFHDLVHVFLHADKGVFTFIPRLVVKPGIIAREFVEGKRRIFNPFQYLIIIVGLVIFLLAHSHFYETMLENSTKTLGKAPSYFTQGLVDFNLFVKQYGNIITLLSLPLFAMSGWLFFRSKGYNYAEHITIQVFAQSQLNTINILFVLLFMVTGTLTVTTAMFTILLMLVCFSITYKQFFSLSWTKAILKSIGVYIVAYIAQLIIMMIGLFSYILVLKSKVHH